MRAQRATHALRSDPCAGPGSSLVFDSTIERAAAILSAVGAPVAGRVHRANGEERGVHGSWANGPRDLRIHRRHPRATIWIPAR